MLSHAAVLGTFALTLFVSATLLFLVQPMVGKMMTPLLGGTPAVWNTCMVFFQAALLAGYLYAHLTSWLSARRQVLVHLGFLLLPLLTLPIAIDKERALAGDTSPVAHSLTLLVLSVGLPFLVVSTSAPMLQKWFAATGHPDAGDPYFLYGASNLGSMGTLLFYPLLVEPFFRVPTQSWLWVVGYVCLVLLTATCGYIVWKAPRSAEAEAPPPGEADSPVDSPRAEPVTWGRRLHWIALAFVPSSLMLGATTFITTDIAAIPLLWVLPLALYLLTFILVFSHFPRQLEDYFVNRLAESFSPRGAAWLRGYAENGLAFRGAVLLLPVVLLLMLFLLLSDQRPHFWTQWVAVLAHLGVLFLVALVCHGALARRRPAPSHLTEFYLWMSVGGVLGGAFNALAAPLLFVTTVEYPLAMVLACMVLPSFGSPSMRRWVALALDVGIGLTIGLLTFEIISGFRYTNRGLDAVWGIYDANGCPLGDLVTSGVTEVANLCNLTTESFITTLKFGIPAVLAYIFVERPLRFGLAVGAMVLAAAWTTDESTVMYRERSFFGALRVSRDSKVDETWHTLVHGNILHGQQFWDHRRNIPCTYYHREGPIGQVIEDLYQRHATPDVAFIGLGSGTLACYALPGQNVDYYEIDRAVIGIAQNPEYFTYVTDARDRGANLRIIEGDARLKIARADRKYRLIAVDAFSSDSIPTHLLTKEALEIYLSRLTDDGIVAFHISNRFLDLEPVLGNLAQETDLNGGRPLAAWVRSDSDTKGGEKSESTWVIVARDKAPFGGLPQAQADTAAGPTEWQEVKVNPKVGVWTDDFTNVLRIFDWKNKAVH